MTIRTSLMRVARCGMVAALAVATVAVQISAQDTDLDAGIAPQAGKSAPKRAARPSSVNGAANPGNAAPRSDDTQVAAASGDEAAERARKAVANFKMPQEIESLLPEWEAKSSQIQYLEGKFILTQYDEIYQTQTMANGEFWYQSPDKGRMDFHPLNLSKFPKDPKTGKVINPKKVGPNGAPYVVKPHSEERWVCTGEKILQIQDDVKQYVEIVIQAQYRGESIKNSPLPFLFGLSKEEAKSRYLLNLGAMHRKTVAGCDVPVFHIVALPLRAEDASEWSRAEVLLRTDNFLPFSIRTNDPPGTSTNVYTFTGLDTDKGFLTRDPFNVSTRGLQSIKVEEAAPPPTSDKTPIKPVTGGLAPNAAGKTNKKPILK